MQIRPPHLTPTTQRTISSSPTTTTNKSIRPHYTFSKSPEQLRSVTGTVTRPRPAHTIVNKSKMVTANTKTTDIKTRTPIIIAQPSPSTPRVSDLDVLMAEKHIHNNNKTSPHIELKPTIISPSPLINNIRPSLFLTDSVKVIRPVRSQELKIFSCHLTTEPSKVSDEILSQLNIDETLSTLTPISSEQKTDNKSLDNLIIDQNDDSSSNTSAVLRDLSEDSLNSLNEHYHIRQLLKSSKYFVF